MKIDNPGIEKKKKKKKKAKKKEEKINKERETWPGQTATDSIGSDRAVGTGRRSRRRSGREKRNKASFDAR